MGAYTQTAEFFMNPESVPFEVWLTGRWPVSPVTDTFLGDPERAGLTGGGMV